MAGTAHAGLDFVDDQHCAVLVAQFADARQVARRRENHACFGLDRFENHTGLFRRSAQLLFQRGAVAEGYERAFT